LLLLINVVEYVAAGTAGRSVSKSPRPCAADAGEIAELAAQFRRAEPLGARA